MAQNQGLFIKGQIIDKIPFTQWREGKKRKTWLIVKTPGGGITACYRGISEKGFRVLEGNPKLFDKIMQLHENRMKSMQAPKPVAIKPFDPEHEFRKKQAQASQARMNKNKARHLR